MTKRSIAIIGGGASATLLLAHLALRPDIDSIHVDIYDRSERFAKGIAYSTPHDCHLLNVRAANMSAFQDDKDHFARWAAEHGYTPSDFVPRKLYGQYLAERMEEVKHKIDFSCVITDVVSCDKNSRNFLLKTKDVTKNYDAVILASGNVRPLYPRVESHVSSYFEDPWTADFETLLKAKTVALVGSGLTAVDMILALGAKGYDGKILVFSRNALLPAFHVDPASVAIELDKGHISPLQMLRLVRVLIKKSRTEGVPWQAVIDALRPHTNPLWRSWSAAERKQFSKRLMTFWNVHRHRMAPQIADYVAGLQQKGQLRLVKSGVRSVVVGPVINSTAGPIPVDAVINCLGYRYDEEGRDYVVSDRIGPARFGELFETTAIPEIRAQAHALALKILP